MSAQTYDDGTARTQSYIMENGQQFGLFYYSPVSVDLYIKVSVRKAPTLERIEEIKQAIQQLSNSREIGENYTTAYIIDMLNVNLHFPEITDIKISADGETWSDTTSFNEGNIGLIAAARVTVAYPEQE